MSDASEWLKNLKQYDCQTCGQKTLWSGDCVDCENKKEHAVEMFETLLILYGNPVIDIGSKKIIAHVLEKIRGKT